MALWKRALLSLMLVLAAAVAIAPSAGSPRTIPTACASRGSTSAASTRDRHDSSSRLASGPRSVSGTADKRWAVSTERLGARGRDRGRRVAGSSGREWRGCGCPRRRRPGAGAPLCRRAAGALRLSRRGRADREAGRGPTRDRRFEMGSRRAPAHDGGRDHAHAQDENPPDAAGRDEDAEANDHARQLRAGDRDPPRVEPPRPLQRREAMAQLPRRDRPGAVSDADRELQHRRHAEEPVVAAAARLRLGARAKPIPPGPGNPLGTRWMGLSAPLVGIHGTPDAASIGYSASHGCIRMLIPDATWLFDRVRIGTPVLIVPD